LTGDLNGDVGQSSLDRTAQALSQVQQFPNKTLCDPNPAPGQARCYARVRTDSQGVVPFTGTPQGFGPADLRSAYSIPASGGGGKIIALVDAQDDPSAESDLGVYRSQFGMSACTTANGCFTKVNQDGNASPLPTADTGWAGEISLDLDMASAACPDCKILLVEANSTNMSDLGAAISTAVKLGAAVVSNSWGGSEDSSISGSDASIFNHPGVAITASAGDGGYGAEYPATSQYVTAVGGTSLVKSSGARGWSEAVWGSASSSSGTGSGCSQYISKPAWQKDTGCSHRTEADVAAVADPNTGVAVYETYGGSGWAVYGGTSAASPLVAGILAITGNSTANGSLSYQNPTAFYDVTTGTNGSCGGSYLCTAEAGYDGPTGNGTPNGAALANLGGGGTCTPNCTGKMCGSDGCGGTCGTCTGGESCNSSGQCVSSCTPSCSGKTCGSDGCGGTCGSCASGETCSSSGVCTGGGGGGGGGGSCSHPICESGKKLVSSCDPCADTICSYDPYCCVTKWDSICVSEVGSICGEGC
jgi:hypothetical protein